jgi:hypothetical protein
MRCFFHLVKDRGVLTDNVGVDAADRETAIAEIFMALWDLRTSDPDAEEHWEGWSLKIVDHTGYVLSTISLNEAAKGGVPAVAMAVRLAGPIVQAGERRLFGRLLDTDPRTWNVLFWH